MLVVKTVSVVPIIEVAVVIVRAKEFVVVRVVKVSTVANVVVVVRVVK